ncbi:MAG: S16 family serine protease [Elusimicrobiota bacterium]
MTRTSFRRLAARLTLSAFAATLPGPAAWAQAVERAGPVSIPAFSAPAIAAPSALSSIPALTASPLAAATVGAVPLSAPALAAAPLSAPAAVVPPEAKLSAPAAASPAAMETLETVAGDAKTDPAGNSALARFDGGSQKGGSSDGDGKPDDKPRPHPTPERLPVLAITNVFFPGAGSVVLSVKSVEHHAQIEAAVNAGGYMIAATLGKGTVQGHNALAALVKLSDLKAKGDKWTVDMETIRPVMITGYEKNAAGILIAKVTYPAAEPSDPAVLVPLVDQAHFYLRYRVLRFAPEVSKDLVEKLIAEGDPERLADKLAQNLPFSSEFRLKLLSLPSIEARLQEVISQIVSVYKAAVAPPQAKTAVDAANQNPFSSADAMKAKMKAIGMPDPISADALKEYEKYAAMAKDSEASKIRTYIEWLLDMPWSVRTTDSIDIPKARGLFNAHHTGLERVKTRILEYLALRKKTGSKKGAIIAFTGPAGVGKTTIASEIAAAMGRKFVRLSLGGVHDESVIRGHGRTYVGSMPGEIMRLMKKAGSKNPVMLLDEVDKMTRNGNGGDPTAALLEALDPKQNDTFRDRYLDEPFDLSEVLFVITANDLPNIPEALRNRMEVIEFDGYTTLEKIEIAKNNIVPLKLAETGLKPEELTLTPAAIRAIAEGYTREAGVRNLEQAIETVLRKVATWPEMHPGEKAARVVDAADVPKYLGVARYSPRTTAQNGVGVATGLSVNGFGGSTLNVEVSYHAGSGQLKLRKQFGDDIEDSAHNALKYVRTHAAKLGLKDVDFSKIDLDLNITPAGKVDGPSAGGLMVTAIVSALTGRPVMPDLAMTGEITMRGDILPIGGLKQKVMAAHRMGYREVIFPAANLKDIEDIPQEVRDEITLTPVHTYDEIYPRAISPNKPAPTGWLAAVRNFLNWINPWSSRRP